MAHTNTSSRKALNTQDPNALKIVYRAQLDEGMKKCLVVMGILNPCSGLLCKASEVYESSYVQIHENRVEVNMPMMFQVCLCLGPCSQINDYVQVYYFDKRIGEEIDRAGFCSPICCPLGINPICGGYVPPAMYFPYPCCPTCFDMCGQGAVLHGKLPILCCHQFAQIPFLADADAFVDAYRQARSAFSGSGAPAQETMA